MREYAHTPMAILSSRGQRSDDAAAARAGCDAFLVKPVRFGQLRQMLYGLAKKSITRMHSLGPASDEIHSIVKQGQSKPRILLAEDNPVNQKVALRMLERMGCQANAVANGREAVKALTDIPYDLVLMDIQMPEMDGYEATRMIRAAETATGRHIPIVAMTAHAMREDRDKCIAAGMDDYVSKPIQTHMLADVLSKHLSRVSGPAEPALPVSNAMASAPPEAAREILNRAFLLERVGGDAETFKSILELFCKDTIRIIGKIQDALAANDIASVREYAHALKGSSGNVGAEVISSLAASLERAARMENIQLSEDRFESIQTAFKECLATIARDP
jgi:CheY-like chemotaxis protein